MDVVAEIAAAVARGSRSTGCGSSAWTAPADPARASSPRGWPRRRPRRSSRSTTSCPGTASPGGGPGSTPRSSRRSLAGQDATYQARDWSDWYGSTLGEWKTQPWSPTVILEGVTCTRRETIGRIAFAVWVEAPAPLRLARGRTSSQPASRAGPCALRQGRAGRVSGVRCELSRGQPSPCPAPVGVAVRSGSLTTAWARRRAHRWRRSARDATDAARLRARATAGPQAARPGGSSGVCPADAARARLGGSSPRPPSGRPAPRRAGRSRR